MLNFLIYCCFSLCKFLCLISLPIPLLSVFLNYLLDSLNICLDASISLVSCFF